jgi:hypothetical protein
MEYMSSEYSSPAEDSDVDSPIITQQRRKQWEEMLGLGITDEGEPGGTGNGAKSGWPEGMGEKVLEVRRPRWRSEAVSRVGSFSPLLATCLLLAFNLHTPSSRSNKQR